MYLCSCAWLLDWRPSAGLFQAKFRRKISSGGKALLLTPFQMFVYSEVSAGNLLTISFFSVSLHMLFGVNS